MKKDYELYLESQKENYLRMNSNILYKDMIMNYIKNYDNISYDKYIDIIIDSSIYIMRKKKNQLIDLYHNEIDELYDILERKYNILESYDILFDFDFSELFIHYFMNRISLNIIEKYEL